MQKIIKILLPSIIIFLSALFQPVLSQKEIKTGTIKQTSEEVKTNSDAEQEKKAAAWVAALNLKDEERAERVRSAIALHLKTIRDWHNEHPFTTVPAGINPVNGNRLSELDRQIIANSAMPKSVHDNLMSILKTELKQDEVETILDRYTVGKVAFTMAGYKAIVPDLTKEEEATIMGLLKLAREQAIDFKNMNQISAIFEIYKSKSEQHLNAHGRNWKVLYKTYTDAARMKKEAQKNITPEKNNQ